MSSFCLKNVKFAKLKPFVWKHFLNLKKNKPKKKICIKRLSLCLRPIHRIVRTNAAKTVRTTVNLAHNSKKGMQSLMWCIVLHRWKITLLIKMQIFIVCNNLRLLIYGLLFVTHCQAGRIFGEFSLFFSSSLFIQSIFLLIQFLVFWVNFMQFFSLAFLIFLIKCGSV